MQPSSWRNLQRIQPTSKLHLALKFCSLFFSFPTSFSFWAHETTRGVTSEHYKITHTHSLFANTCCFGRGHETWKLAIGANSWHYCYSTCYKNVENQKHYRVLCTWGTRGWLIPGCHSSHLRCAVDRFLWKMSQMHVLGEVLSLIKTLAQTATIHQGLLSWGGVSLNHRLQHKLSHLFLQIKG